MFKRENVSQYGGPSVSSGELWTPDKEKHPQAVRTDLLERLTDVAQQRLREAQEKVAAAGLDYLLVTDEHSLSYFLAMPFIKMERPFIFVIPPTGQKPFFILPKFEKDYVGKGWKVHPYDEYPAPPGKTSYMDAVVGALNANANIGVENETPTKMTDELRQKGFLVRTTSIIDDLRVIKQPAEIDAITWASHYAVLAMEEMLGKIYPGISVVEIYALVQGIKKKMIQDGAWTTLWTEVMGPAFWKSRVPSGHYLPKLGDRMEDGANILFAMARVHGRWAEMERTVLVNPTPELVEVYRKVEEVREAVFRALRPGIRGAEIDELAKRLFANKGLAEEGRHHRTGHFIGLQLHDVGDGLAMGGDACLVPGTVFSVEPGVVLPDDSKYGGSGERPSTKKIIVRDSDTVVMGEDGPVILTRGDYGCMLSGDPLFMRKAYQRLILHRVLRLDREEADLPLPRLEVSE